MKEYEWKDGLRPGGRRPRLYFVVNNKATKFNGKSLERICVVRSAQYKQCGKWSNTTYRLALAPGVRVLELLSPLHQNWGDQFGSWEEAAAAIKLPLDETKRIIGQEYRTSSARLDRVEREMATLIAEVER